MNESKVESKVSNFYYSMHMIVGIRLTTLINQSFGQIITHHEFLLLFLFAIGFLRFTKHHQKNIQF